MKPLPFGWARAPDGMPMVDPAWLDHLRDLFVNTAPYGSTPEEQHTLAIIRSLRAEGMTAAAIVAHLEAHGIKVRK